MKVTDRERAANGGKFKHFKPSTRLLVAVCCVFGLLEKLGVAKSFAAAARFEFEFWLEFWKGKEEGWRRLDAAALVVVVVVVAELELDNNKYFRWR